jgi:dipeptide/tripeptide permease
MSGKQNIFSKFPRTFWLVNTFELFERWAYYGMLTVLSVYLTDPVSQGGLGFTQSQRGVMQAVATALLYLIPILGGAIADKFGYRRVLLAAFVTLASGYFAMGSTHAYSAVFMAFLLVALGGAIFKPIIVATISKTTTKETDTLGYGIFYMIVNIGGFIGPFVASKLRDINWYYVFIMCTLVILLNLVLLYFYKEPKSGKIKNDETLGKALKIIFDNSFSVLKDWKFLLFLVIIVGMWTMYMQLFFTLPVFITQWVDTSDIYNFSSSLSMLIGTTEDGQGIIRPEMMINIPAFTIILFQLFISNRLKNIRPVSSMVFGIAVIAIGYGQMAFQSMGWYIALGTVIIAFGEMASSPRIQEYISRIAPRDKVALYMGYSFLPVAGGNFIGGLLSGILYERFSDKYIFLKNYIVENGLNTAENFSNTDQAELFRQTAENLNLSSNELTFLLYNQYSPGNIWLIFASIGLFTSVCLFLYSRLILQKVK